MARADIGLFPSCEVSAEKQHAFTFFTGFDITFPAFELRSTPGDCPCLNRDIGKFRRDQGEAGVRTLRDFYDFPVRFSGKRTPVNYECAIRRNVPGQVIKMLRSGRWKKNIFASQRILLPNLTKMFVFFRALARSHLSFPNFS